MRPATDLIDAHPRNLPPPTTVTTPEVDPEVQLPNLPSPNPINAPDFTWGNLNATDFSDTLEATYTEVIHWRRNCFTVSELSKLYFAFASASSVALKAVTILPILLLQKPQRRSKAKEHITCLERRLRAWREGNLNDLVLEGRTIQHWLPPLASHHTPKQPHAANLMHSGTCKAALDLLSNNTGGGERA